MLGLFLGLPAVLKFSSRGRALFLPARRNLSFIFTPILIWYAHVKFLCSGLFITCLFHFLCAPNGRVGERYYDQF